MRGTTKSWKPPKAPKKKSNEHPKEEIPEEVSQPEARANSDDVAAIEDQGSSSEYKLRRGDRGRERDMTTEISDPTGYATRPGGESLEKRIVRL